MRPVLLPHVARAWRDARTVQFGAPLPRLVVGELDEPLVRLLQQLDGRRSWQQVVDDAERDGAPEGAPQHLLTLLDEAFLLADASDGGWQPTGASRIERERLAPELVALALRAGPRAAHRRLAGRAGKVVAVHGAGRVGTAIAALLAAAGVGRVVPHDAEFATPSDVSPSGLPASAVGQPRAAAAAEVIRRVARETELPPRARPDLVVDTCPAAVQRKGIERDAPPLLAVSVRDGRAIVGPLVLPGATACLRCLDLSRRDRDPRWPLVAAQLAAPSPPDVLLANAAATLAAAQVLCFLDGDEPRSAGATLEFDLPGAAVRRRSWPRHRECECVG